LASVSIPEALKSEFENSWTQHTANAMMNYLRN